MNNGIDNIDCQMDKMLNKIWHQEKPGLFQGFFRAVKRPQKLNIELSFETQSSHQSFSAVKMKLFEL